MQPHLDHGHVVIRPAGRSDLAALLDFRMAMLDELLAHGAVAAEAGPELRGANEAWLSRHLGRDFEAWLVELDGRTVACAGVIWFEHPPGRANPLGREAYLLNVYTRPEARRMGLARKLVLRIVAEARAAGIRRIWLRASADGRPLYAELGFHEGNYLELGPD